MRSLATLALFLLAGTTIAGPPAGRWKLNVARGVETELSVAILQIEEVDGKWTSRLVARNTAMGQVIVGNTTLKDGVLTMALTLSDDAVTFEGRVTDSAYTILGTLGQGRKFSVANLASTEDERIDREKMKFKRDLPQPLKDFAALDAERAELAKLLLKAFAEDRERLIREQDAHRAKMAREVPELLNKAITEHPDHPATYFAGLDLLAQAYRSDHPAERIQSWAKSTLQLADRFGPRCRADTLLRLVDALGRCPNSLDLATDLARQADRDLGKSLSAAEQEAVLGVLVHGLTATGKASEAGPFAERLKQLDAKAEADFNARIPKFNVHPFEKRKPKANRIALVEIFCGSQCPSSGVVAVAFQRFAEIYKPSELIALQYHIHVPGPDALACPDGLERWTYYSNAFPNATDVVPASFFNGFPRSKGGGPLTQSRTKLDAYLSNINEVLAEPTALKVALKAKRAGDKVTLNATVDDAGDDLKSIRLRMAIVEEVVRYHGGNGVRVHHRVVRAMPGGPAGITLTKSDSKHTASVDLADLRKKINAGLDEYTRNYSPLPSPARPTDFAKLKAVAWVQDDTDHFIWQAVECDIESQPTP
ncbi:MAG: hypothetical protein K1X57_17240 [Gemmataceae bacterium]|nr:hypothetical protein [Gemmataceae bacterium]